MYLDGLENAAPERCGPYRGRRPELVCRRFRTLWKRVTDRFPCFRSSQDFYRWLHNPSRRLDAVRRFAFTDFDEDDRRDITTALALLLPQMPNLIALDCPAPAGRSIRAFTEVLNSLSDLKQLSLRHLDYRHHDFYQRELPRQPHFGSEDELGIFDHGPIHSRIRTLHLHAFCQDTAWLERTEEPLPLLKECVLHNVMRGEEMLDWIMRSAENIRIVSFAVDGDACSTEEWDETVHVDVLLAALRHRRRTLRCLHVTLGSKDTPATVAGSRRTVGDAIIKSMGNLRALELGKGVRVSSHELRRLGTHVQLLGLAIDWKPTDDEAADGGDILLAVLSMFSQRKGLVRFHLLDGVGAGPSIYNLKDVLQAMQKQAFDGRCHINVFRTLAGLPFH